MRIKQLRMAAGMSQAKMSEVFGIPKRTIENWDAGISEPPEWAARLVEKELERIIAKNKKDDE